MIALKTVIQTLVSELLDFQGQANLALELSRQTLH